MLSLITSSFQKASFICPLFYLNNRNMNSARYLKSRYNKSLPLIKSEDIDNEIQQIDNKYRKCETIDSYWKRQRSSVKIFLRWTSLRLNSMKKFDWIDKLTLSVSSHRYLSKLMILCSLIRKALMWHLKSK